MPQEIKYCHSSAMASYPYQGVGVDMVDEAGVLWSWGGASYLKPLAAYYDPASGQYILDPGSIAALGNTGFSGVKNTAVILGDSLIDNGSGAGVGVRNSRSIVQHALRKLGRPIKILAEVGYSGKRTDEIFSHWDEIVTANNPGIVFWESGTNDFNNADTAETTFSRLRVAHRKARQQGRRFIYIGMPPLYYSGVTAAFVQRVRQLAHEDPSFEYTGGAERLLNYNGTPAQLATPTQIASMTADGTHPSALGTIKWAEAIVDYFQRRGHPYTIPFTPAGNSGVQYSSEYSNNMVVNGLVGASGSGWSASVASAGTRTAANTQVDMAPSGLQAILPGRLFNTVWSPGAGPTDQDVMSVSVVTDNNGAAAQFADRRFVARCYVKASATGGVINDLHLNAVGYSWDYGTILFDAKDNKAFDISAPSLPVWGLASTAYEGVFETEEFTLPSTWTGPTQAHFIGSVKCSAAPGATVTMQVGCMEIVEVFDL